MYDVVTHVPTIFWSPGRFQSGARRDGLCQLMDIGQTILELGGAEVPATMETVSLLLALTGDNWNGREYVFAEHPPDSHWEGPYMTMIRDQRWKLVHFVGATYGQLFDLDADPDEKHNLWDDPASAEIKQKLLLELLNWRTSSSFETRSLFAGHR